MRGHLGHCRGAAELWSPVCREDPCLGSGLLLWESRTLQGRKTQAERSSLSCCLVPSPRGARVAGLLPPLYGGQMGSEG